MNITISDKSPVYGKLIALGHKLSLDPALLAAGMCHAALNAPGTQAAYQSTPAPAEAPAAPAPVQDAAPVHQPAAAGSSGMFDNIPA